MWGHIFVLGCHAFLDLASVEDWGKEKFAEGVGIKWKKPLRQTSKLQAKRAAKVYCAFHSKIMPALWAKCINKILLIRKRINHVIQVFEINIILNSWLCLYMLPRWEFFLWWIWEVLAKHFWGLWAKGM